MIWGGNMQKILRISFANIRKHKTQSALLGLLITLCMAIAATALAGQYDLKDIFPTFADKYAVHKNAVFINSDYFNDGFMDILREDGRVTDAEYMDFLYSTGTKYLDKDGKDNALYMSAVTREMEQRIEHSDIATSLSQTEIAAIEHPVYLPYNANTAMGFREGDSFGIICGTKVYPFTVAGFYGSMFMPESNNGFQIIVSEEDYVTMMNVLGHWKLVMFDCVDTNESENIYLDFKNRIEEYTGKDAGMQMLPFYYSTLETNSMRFVSVVTYIMLVMAVIVLIAAAIMIRFRIKNDIEEQIQSIGVLEALGYTSKDISLAYTAEYMIISLAGIAAGTAFTPLLLNILHSTGESLSGYRADTAAAVLPVVLTALAILLLVFMVAFIGAGAVKRYPPVTAFRKGIAAHHFGKNVLPLKNTGKNIHMRLAMKGFLQNIRHNIGITVCILVTSIAAAAGIIMVESFGSDLSIARKMAGFEFSDYNITTVDYADTDALAEEIRQLPGVRKVLVGTFSLDISSWDYLYAYERTATLLPVAYEDYGECEDISPSEGRLPEHANEAAVSMTFASKHGLKVGDNITVEKNGVRKNFLITGKVTAVAADGMGFYITREGLHDIAPAINCHAIDIYLEDDTDREAFNDLLLERYGKSISDTAKDGTSGDTAEERIRAEAEKQIAELMKTHGVTHLEYTIRLGDKVIRGTSGSFLIKSEQNLNKVLLTQMGGLFRTLHISALAFTAITAVVVCIIISILMEQTVRRQRRELGIMLSMGYTSKELMFQLAMRIMPAVITAVILGSAASVFLFTELMKVLFGEFNVNIPTVVISGIVMTLFCFGCAYFGAGRIKKISVTELMTE